MEAKRRIEVMRLICSVDGRSRDEIFRSICELTVREGKPSSAITSTVICPELFASRSEISEVLGMTVREVLGLATVEPSVCSNQCGNPTDHQRNATGGPQCSNPG